MPPATAPAPRAALGPRAGSAVPAGVQAAVRGAARAVAATVGAVLAGLVLALPAAHLPLAGLPGGVPAASPAATAHRPWALLVPGAASTSMVAALVRSTVGAAATGVHRVVDAGASLLVPALLAPWVLPTAAAAVAPPLVGRRSLRAPGWPAHLRPAPLRGPPAPLAPAP